MISSINKYPAWEMKSIKLWRLITENIERVKAISFRRWDSQSLCEYIDTNRDCWTAQIKAQNGSFLKFSRKVTHLKYSVYVARNPKKDKVKVFINLGPQSLIGEGASKIVFLAVDYDKMKFDAFAKIEFAAFNPQYREEHFLDATQELKWFQSFPDNKTIIQTPYAGLMGDEKTGKMLFFMTYYEMGTLYDNRFSLSPNSIHQIMHDLIDAIAYIHSKDAVYQDLKPENIFLDSNVRAKLGDLGYVRKVAEVTKTLGNRRYSSPLKLREKLIHLKEADVWALGNIFYSLIYSDEVYSDEATRKWNRRNSTVDVAKGFEFLFWKEMPKFKRPVDKLIFGMMHPDPTKAINLVEAKEIMRKLSPKDCAMQYVPK